MSYIQTYPKRENIVILGGGFAGMTLARSLARKLRRAIRLKKIGIFLINEEPTHLFTPALYEIASMPKDEASAEALRHTICIPIDDILKNTGVLFLQGRVTSVNRFEKTVYFADRTALEYDTLVVASGSETDTMHINGVAEHALFLKTFKDAIRLRNAVEKMMLAQKDLRIVVAGGGPSGVELVAEFYNYTCFLQERVLTRATCDVHLELLEAGESILNGFPQWFVRAAVARLRSIGVNIRTHARVVEVTSQDVRLDDQSRIRADLFIWTGGVRGASVLETLRLPLTKKGTVTVNAFLQPPEDPALFIIGDAGTFIDPRTRRPLPWTVPIAESEARHTAKNIVRLLSKKYLFPYRPRKAYPFILALGDTYAIADLLIVRVSGWIAWFLKQLVELRYLVTILPIGAGARLWIRSMRTFRSNDTRS